MSYFVKEGQISGVFRYDQCMMFTGYIANQPVHFVIDFTDQGIPKEVLRKAVKALIPWYKRIFLWKKLY